MISAVLVAGLTAACAAGSPDRTEPAPQPKPATGAAYERDRQACWAEAERRVQQTPAVSSGQTTYLGNNERTGFYTECMRAKGYAG